MLTFSENIRNIRLARERLSEVGAWVEEFSTDISENNKISFLYVFDPDIIMMYAKPLKNMSYATLLRSETISRSAALDIIDKTKDMTKLDYSEFYLADILGNHFLWNIKNQPILLSPAHVQELTTIGVAIWKKTEKELPTFQQTLIEEFGNLKVELLTCKNKINASLIEDKLQHIIHRLKIDAPSLFEGLRLQQAFINGRIFSTENYRLKESLTSNDKHYYFPSLYDENTGNIRTEIESIANQILQVLTSTNYFYYQNLNSLRTDILVISHLSWLNKQLDAINSRFRVRFVTGSRYLHQLKRINYSLYPEDLSHILKAFHQDICELMRHPLGFLEDNKIRNLFTLDRDEHKKSPIQRGRLSSFLYEKINSNDKYKNIENDDEINRDFNLDLTSQQHIENLYNDTINHCEKLLKATYTRQMLHPEKTWLKDIIKDISNNIDNNYDEIIKERVASLIPNFLASLAVVQAHPLSRQLPRNLPPIRLVYPEEASQLCHKLYKDQLCSLSVTLETRKLLAELIEKDKTLYTPLLKLALFRGLDRDWKSVKNISTSACRIADSIVKSRKANINGLTTTIFGEEAYYLRAVSRKLTAGKIDQLGVLNKLNFALQDLNIAKKRYNDFARKTEYGYSFLQDCRHLSEELSIKLYVLLYEKFGANLKKSDYVSRPNYVHDIDNQSLFDKGYEIFEKLINLDCDHDYFYEYVFQQICVTIIQSVFIDRYGISCLEIFPIISETWSRRDFYSFKISTLFEHFNKQCVTLNKFDDANDSIYPVPVVSSFVKLVWKTFSIELDHISIDDGLESNLLSLLDEKYYVGDIDESRYSFLFNIASHNIENKLLISK